MSQPSIFLVPYDPSWPAKFEDEKKLIESTIGEYITGGVHHIGSTAIPGLSAKPVIDILIGVESLDASRPCIALLSTLQYKYYPYKPDIEHWFYKPSEKHRTHHVHIIPTSHPELKARLAFRDYLRSHLEDLKKYEELKTSLAEKFSNDREAYTDAKEKFVKEIVAKTFVK